jgi:hypothetical protein
MGLFSRTGPGREHESCARRFAEVEERLKQLELGLGERHLQVLEVMEKLAERLTERIRKRTPKQQANGDEIDQLIAVRRGQRWPTEG